MVGCIYQIAVVLVMISAHFVISEKELQEEAQQFPNLAGQFPAEEEQLEAEERCATGDEEEYPFFMRQADPNSKIRAEEQKIDSWLQNEQNVAKTLEALIHPKHNLESIPSMKSAQPHFHSGFHRHKHLHRGDYEASLTPSINLNINQNQQVHSPKQFPNFYNNGFQPNQQLHNVDINQNQQVHSSKNLPNHNYFQQNQQLHNNQFHGAHQNQQFHKSVHHGSFNPTHEELFASQNQEIFRSNPQNSFTRENVHQNSLNFFPTDNHAIPKWTTSRNSDATDSSLIRKTNPKIKNQKLQPMIYAPQYYPTLKSADETNQKAFLESSKFDIVGSPHFKMKMKKKKMPTMFLYPAYNPGYQSYGQGFYRSADAGNEETVASPHLFAKKMKTLYLYPTPQFDSYQHFDNYFDKTEGFREASADPHKFKHKKFKKVSHYPAYYGGYGNLYKEAENEENINTEDTLRSPYLFNVQPRFTSLHYKRSIDHTMSSPKKISKRSVIPLTRLIHDPNVKLDIPKTIENFGTATKQAFEDDKAPINHLKHLIGSSRNAILSALKVAPQNLIIPTKYQIVKDEDNMVKSAQNENTPEYPEFSKTFNRLGEIIRDSIRSGQETAEHINNVAYRARNIIHSAKHSTPRLIFPYSKIPALQDVRFQKPHKAVLITPRVFDLAEGTGTAAEPNPDFVKLSHIMDATGFSNPQSTSLDFQKIIFEPHSITDTSVGKTLENIHNRLQEEEIVGTAVDALENAKVSVGAKNLRQFLLKMKHELADFANPKETKAKQKLLSSDKHERKKEIDKFIETLFDGKQKKGNLKRESKGEETVGSELFLPAELLHPFMNRASKLELHSFLKENGDLDDENGADDPIIGKNLDQEEENEAILGAINPLMMERMFNESVSTKENNAEELGKLFPNHDHISGNDNLGTIMDLTDIMMKPFMGALPQDFPDPPVSRTENGNFLQVQE